VVEDDRACRRHERLFETEGFALNQRRWRSAVSLVARSAPAAGVLDLRLPIIPGETFAAKSSTFADHSHPCSQRRQLDISETRVLLELVG